MFLSDTQPTIFQASLRSNAHLLQGPPMVGPVDAYTNMWMGDVSKITTQLQYPYGTPPSIQLHLVFICFFFKDQVWKTQVRQIWFESNEKL